MQNEQPLPNLEKEDASTIDVAQISDLHQIEAESAMETICTQDQTTGQCSIEPIVERKVISIFMLMSQHKKDYLFSLKTIVF